MIRRLLGIVMPRNEGCVGSSTATRGTRNPSFDNALVLDMHSNSPDEDRPPVLIVRRVLDVLYIPGDENMFSQLNEIVGLDNLFQSVIEVSIADEKTMPSRPQIVLVISRKAIENSRNTNDIIRS